MFAKEVARLIAGPFLCSSVPDTIIDSSIRCKAAAQKGWQPGLPSSAGRRNFFAVLVHIATGYNYCVDTAAPVHLPMPRKLFCYLFGISPAGIIVPIIDQTFSHGADQPGLWMSG